MPRLGKMREHPVRSNDHTKNITKEKKHTGKMPPRDAGYGCPHAVFGSGHGGVPKYGSDLRGRTICVVESLPKDQVKKKPAVGMLEDTGRGHVRIPPLICFWCFLWILQKTMEWRIFWLHSFWDHSGGAQRVLQSLQCVRGVHSGFQHRPNTQVCLYHHAARGSGEIYPGHQQYVLPEPHIRHQWTITTWKKGSPREYQKCTKLYIGNLYTSMDNVQAMFEEYGKVIDCYMPTDRDMGGSRGLAFVTMDPDTAMSVMEETDRCKLDSMIIRVNKAQPKERRAFNDDSFEDNGDSFVDD